MTLIFINNIITPENKTQEVAQQPLTSEMEKHIAAAAEGAANAVRMAEQYGKMEDLCRQVIENGIHDDMCFLVDKIGAEKAIGLVTNGQLNKN